VEEGIGGRLEVRFKGLEEEIKGIVEGVKRKLEDVRITRDGGCQTEGEFRDEEEARREVERMEREAILGDNEGLRKAINTVVADNEVVKKYNEGEGSSVSNRNSNQTLNPRFSQTSDEGSWS